MTSQDFADYLEASALGDVVTCHVLAVQAESDRVWNPRPQEISRDLLTSSGEGSMI
jgi:hypothetical protein